MTRSWLWLWLWLVGLAGCGDRFGAGESEPADAGAWTASSPRALACDRLAEETCAQVEACAPFLARTTLGQGQACVQQLAARCLTAFGLGGSRRTPEVLTACADAIKASTCFAFLTAFPDNCPLPEGALADDAPCAFDEQCGSTFCAREPDTACGACRAAPLAGEACLFGRCAPGLSCTTAGTCVRPAPLGGLCGPNEPCGRLAFCDTNVCVARRAVGEECGGFGQCDAYGAATCAANSICLATKLAKKGEPCDLTANALVLCEAPYRCIGDRCVEPKPEGATCGVAGAHECAGFQTECLRGRCVSRVVEACGGGSGP